ncbi:MAG: type II and III secretion system protein [Thermodesulfobacteriota bacterium]
MLASCASSDSEDRSREADRFIEGHTAGAVSAESKVLEETVHDAGVLPSRFQNPSFLLDQAAAESQSEMFSVPVGADISSNRGPVKLRDILKRLAVLKRMNVSWADDVDQHALVDVDIRAEDDFYNAIDNILRQLDYFYEVEGNSLVVKYRDTRTFHVAMPFLKPTYSIGIGGDVLGSAEASHKMKGRIEMENQSSGDDSFDVWANIEGNLDKILEIYTETEVAAVVDTAAAETAALALDPVAAEAAAEAAPPTSTVRTQNQGALGYYMVDKPVGLVSVTAPRSLLNRIEKYFASLKKVLYKQIAIEAKIVEVTLANDNRTGIDWTELLDSEASSGLAATLNFPKLMYPGHETGDIFTISAKGFELVLDAMKRMGHIEILANPRVSVMNGQPSIIHVGKDYKYIEKIETNVSDGVITTTATTGSVVSGLGLAVVPTILGDDEVVINLTPVTSELLEDIEYKSFGVNGQVGLPKVAIKQMSSTVRVKSGEMLVVGGLIDSNKKYENNKIVGLGDIPLAGKLFRFDGDNTYKTEMVILLRPVIIN